MHSHVRQAKEIALKFQVLSEAEDRKNVEFLADIRQWLTLLRVSPETQETVLKYVEIQFGALEEARRTIKALMNENLKLAIKDN